ncbi:MAG: hypothetical protein E6G97_22775 [Alphaproteobacteria bacterium]|nr:MAG: hypothetical protein E6G97_22775 [Alphaproteobacteria bacterium]
MKFVRYESISPIRFFDLRIERSARDQVVAQMWGYGEAFGFRMLVKNYRAKPDDMFFQMWRPDVDLLASNDSDTGARDIKIGIGFYPKRGQRPPSPENVTPLVEGLRQFLDKVPGAAITEVTAQR